jgi:hypothetical protein
LPDAQAIGERSEEIEHFPRRLLPRVLALGAARHQEAQRGRAFSELDQDHANILDHREEHLAQALGLRRALVRIALRRRRPDLVHPCRAGDERRRIGAEASGDVVRIERMGAGEPDEQRRTHRPGIEFQAGDDHRRADRTVDQELAVAAALVPAALASVRERSFECAAVFVWIDAGERVEPIRDGFRRGGFSNGVRYGDHLQLPCSHYRL